MKRIVSEFGEEGSGKLTFKAFLQVMTQKMVREPSRSQRVKVLLPNLTMQVATVDWVTLVPCSRETGVLQGCHLSYFSDLPLGELSFHKLQREQDGLVQINTAASQQKSPSHSTWEPPLPFLKPFHMESQFCLYSRRAIYSRQR